MDFTTEINFERHQNKSHKNRGELNCNECQFQASTGPELRKHLNSLNHKAPTGISIASLGETFKCKDCNDEFSDFWNLMNHRRTPIQKKEEGVEMNKKVNAFLMIRDQTAVGGSMQPIIQQYLKQPTLQTMLATHVKKSLQERQRS